MMNIQQTRNGHFLQCETAIRLSKVSTPIVDISIEHLLGKFPVVDEFFSPLNPLPIPLAQKDYNACIMATIHGACLECVRGRSHERLPGCHKSFHEKLIDIEGLQEEDGEEML